MTLSPEQEAQVEERVLEQSKSIPLAYVLWFFLGPFGAHRFFLGRVGSGLGMLCLLVFGFTTIGMGINLPFPFLAILSIWYFLDAFLIPGMVRRQREATRQREREKLLAMEGD